MDPYQQQEHDALRAQGMEILYHDDPMPRLNELLKEFEVDLKNPDALAIWKAFKKFMEEPILSAVEDSGLEYIFAKVKDDHVYWSMIRQTENFYTDRFGRREHLEYVQLTINLKYEKSENLKHVWIDEGIFKIYDLKKHHERIARIEATDSFKALISSVPYECTIDLIPQ